MSQIIPTSPQGLAPRDSAFLQNLREALQTSLKNRPYTAYITRKTPSAFLFLIDQSGSMNEAVTLADGKTRTKAQFLADALNTTLNSILDRCIKGSEIRDYFEVAVIGYGGHSGTASNFAWTGKLADKTWVTMTELAQGFVGETETEIIKVVRGQTITSRVKTKSWLAPLAKYQTPMHHALRMAGDLLEDWIVRHRSLDVYPPTVINITDGKFTDASDAEIRSAARRITDLYTADGHVLLFNLHISAKNDASMLFPYCPEELPDDEYARLLFDISSDLPDVYNLEIARFRGMDLMQTFTGMAYNAPLDKVVAMMNIGTSTTTRQIQNP